jgi:negative regulator of flagellin synthesis FlgM
MKISQKGPADAELNRLVQNDKAVGGTRREGDAAVQKERESSRVDISPQARKLQRIAELARGGDELRAEKVKQLKEQVKSGQYQPDSKEVAQSIARSEVARLLGEK